MTYAELISKLFNVNLFGGMKLGLSNIEHLCATFRHPERSFASIHVAGTNGKGSVTTKIAKALELEGKRVGLYTSPHISCFRERIKINGEMISESEVEEILPDLLQNQVHATFFEITTLLAFLHFAKHNVDIAILETGLGGRLDATNVVTPMLSVITSISLEHTEILGTSLEDIAREKAGIIKASVPVVIGPRVPEKVIREIAQEKRAPLTVVSGNFPDFESENCAIVKTALERIGVSAAAIQRGCEARPPCRMETFTGLGPPAIVLDVAHNPDGLQALFHALKQRYPSMPFRVLCGLSKTKDIDGCLTILAREATQIHFVEAANGRGAPVSELKQRWERLSLPKEQLKPFSRFSDLIQQATSKKEVLVVCGTFFIMSQIRQALGIQEPRDLIDMNERR